MGQHVFKKSMDVALCSLIQAEDPQEFGLARWLPQRAGWIRRHGRALSDVPPRKPVREALHLPAGTTPFPRKRQNFRQWPAVTNGISTAAKAPSAGYRQR